MNCPVCDATSPHAMPHSRRSFFRCEACGFVWADPSSRLDPPAAKARYGLHRNTVDNEGYVAFLNSILDRTLERVERPVRTVLDWGSGPEAVCAEILRCRGFEVAIWDPFFAPEQKPADGAFDLVVCIEVAEHFETPCTDFGSLVRALRPGGVAAVHTHQVPSEDGAFLRWWYAEDPTHVSFYSQKAMEILAHSCGLDYPVFVDDRLSLFAKRICNA